GKNRKSAKSSRVANRSIRWPLRFSTATEETNEFTLLDSQDETRTEYEIAGVEHHPRSAGATLTLLPCSARRRKQGLDYAFAEQCLSPLSRGGVCRSALYCSRSARAWFGSG
ncbi:MAG TPA: hypothetical protein VN966_04015, partial [Candidatus Bathyarchaeia archaeon]|nr:hypothetical protein [Candidatus Bathyarchaeia archaeon]